MDLKSQNDCLQMSLDSAYLNTCAPHICTVKVPLQSSEVREENPERLCKIGGMWTEQLCLWSQQTPPRRWPGKRSVVLPGKRVDKAPPQPVCSPPPCLRRSSVSLRLTLLMAPQPRKGGTFEVGQVAAGKLAVRGAGGAGHPSSPSGSEAAARSVAPHWPESDVRMFPFWVSLCLHAPV